MSNPDELDFLIREVQPDGVIKVRPRFDFPLNGVFSNMSKEEKKRLLQKSEEDQINELKELYRIEFINMPIDHQKGILKKLTYANSKYDTYKMAEMLPILQLVDPSKKKSEYNLHKISPRQQLLFISKQLLDSSPGKYNDYEMEVKFGTRGIKHLTKIDYDNVVKKLKEMNFRTKSPSGFYTLKIQPEFLDFKTGEFRTAGDFNRFRVEIDDLSVIQEYCRTNNLDHLINTKYNNVSILKKLDAKVDDEVIQSADFDEFNFRVTYKVEETVSKNGKIGQELIDNWNKSRKLFRYIKRVSFVNDDYPFRVDLSIVRSSSKDEKGRLIKTYNVQDSNVFQNPETYEIEIEVINSEAKIKYNNADLLTKGVEHIAKIVLSGLQCTNFPISYTEQKRTLTEYMKLIHEAEFKKKNQVYVPKERIYPNDFIGPSSVTLQIKNIAPINPDMTVPNITAPYSFVVTDKADGDRHLLYVNDQGRIYLINMNMNVLFTGAKSENPKCFNSLIDGELILHNKSFQFINTFAAFDIYFVSGNDVRARPFVEVPTKDAKYFTEGCRLPLLKEFIKTLKPVSILSKSADKRESRATASIMEMFKDENKSPITIVSKSFYPRFKSRTSKQDDEDEAEMPDKYNIFEACNYIQQRIESGLYNYFTDGLIFTPTLLGVGSNNFLEAGPLKKVRWDYSFKWKPPQYNTIDFLVSTKKGSDGNDIVTPIFEPGMNMHETTQFNQYKTLILKVGFDEKRHGYINPCQDLLDDKLPQTKESENEDNYRPVQFYPSDPFDPQAGLCNVMLETDASNNPQMFTINRQTFEDNTIVEFAYNNDKTGLWKWEPIRVRYDKTAEFRQGYNSFGNDYTTANNNWYSIHNPITEVMLFTGQEIPDIAISDDIYYNSMTSEKLTIGMRDFHNLVVKKMLIQSVSRKGNNLIDYACGKGGDFPKWIASNLSFVFGIDISKDNIENRINGACARFLNYKRDFKQMPYALFVNGNSSKNIRSGDAMLSDKAIAITKAVFGSSTADVKLGPAVSRQHGKGADGFNVSSCQFALHYMFENNVTFYNFMRNVAECTKINGYFITTCYDGKTIFKMLNKKEQGESVEIYKDDKKVWSVTKDYDGVSFADDDSSLGYQISVYQDSINQTLPEYLVNFDFLVLTMEKYGFALVTRDEAKTLGLPEGSGMFIELYNMMMDNIRRNPKSEKDYGYAPDMTKYEKDISFLNRYCVFKKIAERNVEKLTNVILGKLPSTESYEVENTVAAVKAVASEEAIIEKKKARPLKKKLMLVEATEAVDEPNALVATAEEKPKAKPRAKPTKKAEEAVPEGTVAKKTRKVKGKVEFAIVDEN